MDIFDNCRICLREINHEPIKMTRIILRFFEIGLQLANVAKPHPQANVKQNLCAQCFNKISDFQDFLEQCKDSDEFWKIQFDDFNENNLKNKELSFEQTVLFPLTEDSNSLEADTTVSTTELKKPINEDENSVHSPQLDVEQEKILSPSSQITEEKETTEIEVFTNIDLANWTDDKIEIPEGSECSTEIRNLSEEVIEYEYELEEYERVKIEEIAIIDELASSDASGVDYRSFDYEKMNKPENSGKSTITHESIEENMEAHKETTKSSYFLATTIDENGKVKMFYKCQHCDKSFNRIYDIESHSFIHNGIKPFTCNVCGKSFRQKNILTTHQALHFGKKVECAECGKKFARRSQLILHYRMHRDEKPFECNYAGCQAAFRQRKQLVDHSFIHTGEKNFQCATCSKSFHNRKRLQDHIYKVHSQHRYRCELCEKAFLKPHMLKHHMMTAHNVEMDDVSHLKTLIDASKTTKKSSR